MHMSKSARLLLTLAFSLPASSDTVFTNLGVGDTFSSGSLGIFVNSWIAADFVPSASGTLTSIRLPFSVFNTPDADLLISLRAPGTDPTGTVIETWSLSVGDISPAPGSLETLISALNPALVAGTAYWLRAESLSSATSFDAYGWNQNVTGDIWFANSLNQGATWGHHNHGQAGTPAFEVNANPLGVNSVPEPSSIIVLAMVLVGIALALRQRTDNSHQVDL
jgi:hypothetical protein